MTSPEPSTQPRPESRFGGWLLIVIGALIVLLCGGCTLTFWAVSFASIGRMPAGMAVSSIVGILMLTGLVGGLPTAGGAILVWAGWRVLHPIRTPRDAAKSFE